MEERHITVYLPKNKLLRIYDTEQDYNFEEMSRAKLINELLYAFDKLNTLTGILKLKLEPTDAKLYDDIMDSYSKSRVERERRPDPAAEFIQAYYFSLKKDFVKPLEWFDAVQEAHEILDLVPIDKQPKLAEIYTRKLAYNEKER